MVTLALPTYNSSPILWLQLESLCRQETQHEWELIVCEDPSKYFAGESYLDPYRFKLEKAGCKQITYISLDRWVPLSYKWKLLASLAEGDNFLLVASDDYSPPNRIETTVNYLKSYDWVDWSHGVFLDLYSGNKAQWNKPSPEVTGLFMGTKTKFIQSLQGPYPKRFVDNWIKNQQNIDNRKFIEEIPQGICTDGTNQISLDRKNLYDNPAFFTRYWTTLNTLIPQEVVNKLEFNFPKIK